MQMNLEIAQYVQSKYEEVIQNYTQSDMSRAFIKTAGTDLMLCEFGVYVSNSQELTRQLEMLRELFLQNNTTGATPVDLAAVILSNSPSEIRAQLETSWKRTQELQQSQQQQQSEVAQQQMEMQAKMQADKLAWEANENELDRANERILAEIKAVGMGTVGTGPDADGNGIPDALEIQKFDLEQNKHSEDVIFKRQQEANKQQDSNRKMDLEEQRTKVQEKQIASQEKQAEEDRKIKLREIESKEKIARSKPRP